MLTFPYIPHTKMSAFLYLNGRVAEQTEAYAWGTSVTKFSSNVGPVSGTEPSRLATVWRKKILIIQKNRIIKMNKKKKSWINQLNLLPTISILDRKECLFWTFIGIHSKPDESLKSSQLLLIHYNDPNTIRYWTPFPDIHGKKKKLEN